MTVDRQLALKFAGDIALAYPGRNVTDDHATAWAREFTQMSEYEARRVVELVTSRSLDPPSRAAIRAVYDEVRAKTMSPAFDTSLCVFMDGVACRNCGEIHGHPLAPGELLHGVYHLRELLAGDQEHREASIHPRSCECGFAAPAGLELDHALEQTTRSMFGESS